MQLNNIKKFDEISGVEISGEKSTDAEIEKKLVDGLVQDLSDGVEDELVLRGAFLFLTNRYQILFRSYGIFRISFSSAPTVYNFFRSFSSFPELLMVFF
jgi:hypothetical protein